MKLTDGAWTGAELEGIVCRHPWLDRDSKVILGEFVTQDQGTGAVHIAPGHGQEDYEVGMRYGLPVMAPVDPEGKFTAEAGDLQGRVGLQGGSRGSSRNWSTQAPCSKKTSLSHSYPHCWRCKKPVIFRATEQWFISMEKNDLRSQALDAIDQVRWIPPWGKDRIRGMLESRPDWCISRQRSWGVPIPAVYCKGCNEAVLTQAIVRARRRRFSKKRDPMRGIIRPVERVAAGRFQVSATAAARILPAKKIFSMSGSIPASARRRWSNEIRAWAAGPIFISKAATSIAAGFTPRCSLRWRRASARLTRACLTHGFTLDGKGRKMSKSMGNAIAPQEIIEKIRRRDSAPVGLRRRLSRRRAHLR